MRKKLINLYFIRHGYSCANYKKDLAKSILDKIINIFSKPRDPQLTDKGIIDLKKHRQKVKKIIPKPDYVFSSYLLRAIQTANYLFPKRKIRVLPYIGEIGYGVDNKPNRPSIQYNFLKGKKVIYSYLGEKNYKRSKNRLDKLDYLFDSYKIRKDKPINNFHKFLSLLNSFTKKDIKNIVVVSHANFLKKLFRELDIDDNPDKKNKPENGSVIKIVLVSTKRGLELYRRKRCQKINDYKKSMKLKKNCYGVKLSGIPRDKNIKKGDIKNC
jgi:broad specificity phosphatase PhoE